MTQDKCALKPQYIARYASVRTDIRTTAQTYSISICSDYLRGTFADNHLRNSRDCSKICIKKARGGNSSRALGGGGYLLSHPG